MKKPIYKGFRFAATIVMLLFMFVEELILAPLRKVKIVLLERTIKRMNGYWTLGILVTLKTIEGLCKVVLPMAPNATVVMIIVAVDGILGFISMNIIIHGHENLKDFPRYVKFVAWVSKLKEEIKATPTYQRVHARFVEIKAAAKIWWGDMMFKIFGKRNPRGLVRYVKTAMYLKRKKSRA